MIEIVEFAIAFWKKSKEDWENNKHRIFALFGFMLVVFLILEFGSYVFTKKLNEAKTLELIRLKFLDKQVELSDQCANKLFSLKEKARLLLNKRAKIQYTPAQCQNLIKEFNIKEAQYEFYQSTINIRYFLGDKIAEKVIKFDEWFEKNLKNCFIQEPNAEFKMDDDAISLRNDMWQQVYPLTIVKGMVLDF